MPHPDATAYRIFDRTLRSSIPLPLLTALPGGAIPVPNAEPEVLLESTSEPLPDGARTPITLGYPSGFRAYRCDDSYVFQSSKGGWGVAVDAAGLRVRIHVGAAECIRSASLAERSIADDITTAILTRLPALWGAVPVHAAALLSPAGLVLLCGPSGAGKSTLSQHLTRLPGWSLVDDDTVSIRLDDGALERGGYTLCSMGTSPRLRADSAATLGVEGRPLPGFAGSKVAVETPRISEVGNVPIVGVFHLRPAPHPFTTGDEGRGSAVGDDIGSHSEDGVGLSSACHGEGSPPFPLAERTTLTRLRAAETMSLLGKSAFSMDLRDRDWLRVRFAFTQCLAQAPNQALAYQRGVDSPDDLARVIAETAEGLSRDQPVVR